MKKVSVVILDYKNKKDTKECINSLDLLDISDISLSLILVNNDTQTIYKNTDFSSKFSLTIINSEKNDGYSGGNNRGIQKALQDNADYILLLNNDTVADKKLVKELLTILERDTNIGLVSPKIYFAKGYEYHKQKYQEKDLGKVFWYAGGIMDWKNVLGRHRGVDEVDLGQYDKAEETDFATGCCMMFPASVIKKIGILDKKYFLYYEDSDFNQRVRLAGLKIVYVPSAILWHKNAGSTGGSGSNLQDYFISRNRLLFGMRYAPLRSKTALIREGIMTLISGRSWQKKGVLDFFLHNFDQGSYPIK